MIARTYGGSPLLAFLLLAFASCRHADVEAPEGPSSEASGGLHFADVTEAAGLSRFRHENGETGNRLFPETMSGGVAFIDFDGDGWPDVLLVGGGHFPGFGGASPEVLAVLLFRNNQDGTFSDVTAEAGLSDVRAYGMGLAVADVDGDGDEDFLLTTTEENLLFRNDGGRFTEIGRDAGVAGTREWSSSAVFFDANRDGWPDLLVGNYVEWTPETDKWCLAGNVKSYCTPRTYTGVPPRYYENRGGTFVDRTEAAGFLRSRGKTLGVAAADVDGDGWVDLILANDTEPDEYFRNRGDGTFEEIGIPSGMALDERGQARAGMGVDIGILDGSTLPAVVVGNFTNEMVGVYQYTSEGFFADRASISRVGGTSRRTLAFGVVLLDADLDGHIDILVANGHVIPEVDDVDDDVYYRQPPHLFINDGFGTFRDVALAGGGALALPVVARGAAYADYDRDGDLDILIVENGGPVRLLQNQQRQPAERPGYVRVRLRGRPPGTSALGARVEVYVQGRRQIGTVKSGSSYLSQSELPLTFGLGSATMVDSIVVKWSSGLSERFGPVSANSDLLLREGGELEVDVK